MIKNMDMEFIFGMIRENIRDGGIKVNNLG